MKTCMRKNRTKCSKELKKRRRTARGCCWPSLFFREVNEFPVVIRFRVSPLRFEHLDRMFEGCPITSMNQTIAVSLVRWLSDNADKSDNPGYCYQKSRSCCLSPRQQLLLVFNIHYLATPAVHSATRSGLASTKASAASSADSPS